jgi:hypothetical protein
MEKQYPYTLSVSVRPRGAQGAYVFHEFPVAYPRDTATPAELFDKWLSLLGDEFEPGVMDQINGQPTKGMHGVKFPAREV